jgi:hypothetical protein
MRAEISLTVTPSDRRQLKALVRDHNAPQKHVWRAESVLLTAEGVGTNENHAPHGRVQDLHRWQNTGIGVSGRDRHCRHNHGCEGGATAWSSRSGTSAHATCAACR